MKGHLLASRGLNEAIDRPLSDNQQPILARVNPLMHSVSAVQPARPA